VTEPAHGAADCPCTGALRFHTINMHFLKHPLRPVDGVIPLPEAPGASMALDADKIEVERSASDGLRADRWGHVGAQQG
jgi:hypothetical protein